jgi:cell division protein FtsB
MKEDILDSFTNSKRHILEYIVQVVILLFFVTLLGIYIGNLFFGKNSNEVLTNIQVQQNYLEKKIKSLQQDNANLQKEYFELKNLEPE